MVVVGRLGYLPIEGTPVQLYIPHDISCCIHSKEQQSNPPTSSLWLKKDNKIYIKVQRRPLNKKEASMLDYPCFVIDPTNLLYPSYLCSWIDCKRRISLASYVIGDRDVN